ncbi:MAG: class I SAM-dependent methyltransferase family protein [Candidatus Methanoperedens sp.]|nr:class I SAM-dependent methyltransferase family protein [Candidatus Methanoperedens sp.]
MSLRSLLLDKLPPEKLSLLPRGFEVIGDIAIINIPPTLDEEKYLIAEALSIQRKDLKTVLRKLNKIEGPARVADFELLLGKRTTTLHRENGCVFQLDVTKTFFSGKMYYERGRIAQIVKDGEDVLVLFAGVGPFLVPIRIKKKVNITGLDNNREACTFLRKNLELNYIEANIILGDARNMNNLFRKGFDRIVMPAPYGQDFFLDMVRSIMRPGGCVHFYTFKKDFEMPHFRRLLEEKGWKIGFFRDCGDVAPRVKRYVFDLHLRE